MIGPDEDDNSSGNSDVDGWNRDDDGFYEPVMPWE